MRDLAKKNCNYDELVEENQFLLRENDCLRKDVAYLEELVRHLKRQKFDRSSEVYSPGQRTLFNESELESSLDNESEPSIDEELENSEDDGDNRKKKKKRGRPIRKPLPDSLPRVEKIVDLEENEKTCPYSGRELKKIGEEVAEQLEIEPTRASVTK